MIKIILLLQYKRGIINTSVYYTFYAQRHVADNRLLMGNYTMKTLFSRYNHFKTSYKRIL